MSLQPPEPDPDLVGDKLAAFADRVIRYGGYLRQHPNNLVRAVGHAIKDMVREELGGEEIKDE